MASVFRQLGLAVIVAGGLAGCGTGAVGARVVTVTGDAPGSAEHPAEVQLELRKGALRLVPSGTAAPRLLTGTVRSDDASLLPHVTVNRRGVSVVQDFTPESVAAANITWDLALGATPMRLFAHVLGSEEQFVDLGGRAIVSARLYNEGGHLEADWSAQNSVAAESVELWSIGYVRARHVARARARRVEVKNVGFAEIDLGDPVEADLAVDVVASAGTLVLQMPVGVTARATIDASPGLHVEAEGWSHEAGGPYTLGAPGSAPRVSISVRASSGAVQLLHGR